MKINTNNELSDNRIRNSTRNVIYGLLVVLTCTVVPFVVRTLMINMLGNETLGLNSLFQSILGIINISESGFATALVFYLYEPAAKGDTKKISAYLNVLRKVYIFIGCFVLICGLFASFFIEKFISGNVSNELNIRLYFWIYLLSNVLPYFISPELDLIAKAFQRNDIVSKITFFSNLLCYFLQIMAIVILKSYLFYVISLLFQQFFVGGFRHYYKKNFFLSYPPKGDISNLEKRNVFYSTVYLFGHILDDHLLNSIDNVFLSSILGLTAVAVYGNYYYIIAVVIILFNIIFGAIGSSIGNAIVVDSIDNNYEKFLSLFWMDNFLTCCATSVLLCVYQNFMYLWLHDQAYENNMVICFCIFFYFSQIRRAVTTYKAAGGMWESDKFKPYVSFAMDLILDYFLISRIGAMGAIISSIICVTIIEIPWETKALFQNYFHFSTRKYYCMSANMTVINVILIIISYLLCSNIVIQNSVTKLLLEGCISITVVISGYILFYRNSRYMRIWKKSFRVAFAKKREQ